MYTYIHVLIVAPEKISAPADIPWRREWRHSANSTPLILYHKTRNYTIDTIPSLGIVSMIIRMRYIIKRMQLAVARTFAYN